MSTIINEWILLTGNGVTVFVRQFFLAPSLIHIRDNRVSNMIYSQMHFALGFDRLLFNRTNVEEAGLVEEWRQNQTRILYVFDNTLVRFWRCDNERFLQNKDA